jgi:two-component system sensor histidine kinase UhpB
MKRTVHILIVEDNKDDLELLLHALKKSKIDFVYKAVETEDEYRLALSNFEPHIILSDYSLPQFDAESAFTLKIQCCPDIPFIIVSGTIGEEKAVNIIKRGVTDYVLKDKLFSLPNKLERALNEYQEKQEKKIAEVQLEENHKKLAEAQLVAKMGNWDINLINGSVHWCDQIYQILGYEPEEVKPSVEFFFSLIPESERSAITEKFNSSLKNLTQLNYKSKIRRKDGSTAYIYASAEIILDKNGKPLRMSGIMQDITETKKMEEDLKVLNKELETFIYRASHDLRGPLSSIIGLTNISKSEIKDETAKRYLQMIETSAQKLDATLISLVQSMTMRDMMVDKVEIDLNELIKDTLSQLKFHDGFERLEFNINNDLKEPILSNKVILSSVFQNLIQNAIKYQNLHNGKPFLNISIHKKDRGIEIIFEDNGIGIDDHLQDKIFDMYFRGTASSSGSGLGLYIVKIGIEKLKGSIRFLSSKGKGTSFIVYLPEL